MNSHTWLMVLSILQIFFYSCIYGLFGVARKRSNTFINSLKLHSERIFVHNHFQLSTTKLFQQVDIKSSDDSKVDPHFITMVTSTLKRSEFTSANSLKIGYKDITNLALKLQDWKQSLSKGHIPQSLEKAFSDDSDQSSEKTSTNNDEEPLRRALYETMIKLSIPRLTQRHPELIPPLLRSILDMMLEYRRHVQERVSSQAVTPAPDENEWTDLYEELYTSPVDIESEQSQQQEIQNSNTMNEPDAMIDVARSITRRFESRWSPALQGISTLDDIYGPNHGLLQAGDQSLTGGGASAGRGGFGLFDGVWSHVGWTKLRNIQDRLRSIVELKVLVRTLGSRPATQGRERKKVPPRVEASRNRAPLSVARSTLAPTEMTGLRRSDSLEGLLPSEMMLLLPSLSKTQSLVNEITSAEIDKIDEISSNTSSTAMRVRDKLWLLFQARRVEKSLGSYEVSGFIDQYSLPRRRPSRQFQRLPTDTGGPIIICLDTSWSMAGPREDLAKAVVLECSISAAKNNRACYVIAFSGTNNLAECALPLGAADKQTIERLLEFLSCSFRGGTDVTGPLLKTLELLDTMDQFQGSDIVLVTDGELSTPPVSEQVLNKIRSYETMKGLEIHGLIIGQDHSIPLTSLCTNLDGKNRLYNFLNKYGLLESIISASTSANSAGSGRVVTSSSLKRESPRQMNMALQMMSDDSRNEDDEYSDSDDDTVSLNIFELPSNNELRATASVRFEALANQAYDQLVHDSVSTSDRFSDQQRLTDLLSVLSQGLIEREMECKMLLLAALCREHILLLGPPGTGKSELGRRLAEICSISPSLESGATSDISMDCSRGKNKIFFERLLTKYTNPEELFGPLSLSALENDQYIRNTDGYLPTATVAFLDEIFKANSAILNSLLTILNERRFDNGNVRVDVPLMAVVAASNELPDSEELDALYDRFLFRLQVNPVSDLSIDALLQLQQQDRQSLLKMTNSSLISDSFVQQLLSSSAKVKISTDVSNIFKNIRKYLRDECEPPIYVSDRRLVKSANMLRLAAYITGRSTVSTLDTLLLTHVLWYDPSDKEKVRDFIWESIVPESDILGLDFVVDRLSEDSIDLCDSIARGVESAVISDSSSTVELASVETILAQKAADFMFLRTQLLGKAEQRVGVDTQLQLNWWSNEDSTAMRQELIPQVNHALREVSSLGAYVSGLLNVLSNERLSAEDRATLVDEVVRDRDSYSTAISSSSVGDSYTGYGADDGQESFSADTGNSANAINMEKWAGMSKKEAQKKLSTEQFKLWKMAQKGKKKNKDDANNY